ncbi:MAG: FHA domain-containing protein [Myxococcales bacterium]|nr:FHA domain-containing protein [Myxococcales bacterium]
MVEESPSSSFGSASARRAPHARPWRHVVTLVAVVLGALYARPASAQGDRMFIDYVDTAEYGKRGLLRYYIDIIDSANKPIDNLDATKLTFRLNNEPFPADKFKGTELRSFSDLGEPMAVAILFTNYRGYIPKSPGEPSLFTFAKAGIRGFLENLTKQKVRIRIDVYNEVGRDPVVEFTENVKGAKEKLDLMPEPVVLTDDEAEGADARIQAPDFYRHLEDVVKGMAALDDLPRRRLLVVISDGVSQYSGARKKLIDQKLEGIIEEANDAGIKIYSFAAMLQDDQFLPYVERAAERTNGFSQRITEPEALESAVRDLAPQLLKQYVVDVTAPGLPSEDKVNLSVDGETPNKEKVAHTYPKLIKLPPTPTDWTKILTWIGIGVGSLLGLIFIIWIIKKIIAARANRVEETDDSGPAPAYTGPDRGKLRVKSGPLAGELFHLTEDVTTIGRIDGNAIVIQDDAVSKRHAGIKIEDMRYELADFNSTSGTWVNGRKINKQFLKDGDEIRIGNTEMTFTLK